MTDEGDAENAGSSPTYLLKDPALVGATALTRRSDRRFLGPPAGPNAGGRGGDFTLATRRRPRSDLKADLYYGRLETYEYPPVMDELLALEGTKRHRKVDRPSR